MAGDFNFVFAFCVVHWMIFWIDEGVLIMGKTTITLSIHLANNKVMMQHFDMDVCGY